MGFESRDYVRDGSYTASLSAWGMDLTPVVKYLIIANVVVFLLQLLLTRPAALPLPDFDGNWPDQEEIAADRDRDADTETDRPAQEKCDQAGRPQDA